MSDVLPLPEGPQMAILGPGGMLSVREFRAGGVSRLDGNCRQPGSLNLFWPFMVSKKSARGYYRG